MRSLAVLCGIVAMVLMAAPAFLKAQPSGPPAPLDSARIEQMISDMKVKVKLTDDQAVKVRSILKESSEAMQRDRASGQINREAAREMMRAADTKVRATLTPEQQPLYDQYREERRQMMRNRMRDMQEKPQ
jgi:hypothetical protein